MTREVLIRVTGLRAVDDEDDDVEMIFTGEYFQKNGKHYIIYDEMLEGFEGKTRNTVRIAPGAMDIRKRGLTNAHMVFEQEKERTTRYITPFGELAVEIYTDQIQLEEHEDRLWVSVDYSLGFNYEHVSSNTITMDVCSKDHAQLSL